MARPAPARNRPNTHTTGARTRPVTFNLNDSSTPGRNNSWTVNSINSVQGLPRDPKAAPSPASTVRWTAVGPNAGRKALTLYTVPPLEDEPAPGLVASIGGFSLHAGTVCEPWQRSRLERLCRYITRPPIATKRLSVDAQGRVVYRYKRPFRDGSTHVVLEPLDFIARLAALAPATAAWRFASLLARSLAGVPISACPDRSSTSRDSTGYLHPTSATPFSDPEARTVVMDGEVQGRFRACDRMLSGFEVGGVVKKLMRRVSG